MDKRTIVKRVVGYTVQFGTGVVVKGIINNNVAVDNAIVKISVDVAAFALGSLIGGAAVQHTDDMIDGLFTAVDKAKEQAKTA